MTENALVERWAGLDGLRAIAVILVVTYHVAPVSVPAGYAGVDMFFVLSGFLIASLSRHEYDRLGRLRFGSFWARRARRLLPALVVLLTVMTFVAWWVAPDALVGIGMQLFGAATFTSNWVEMVTTQDYFAASGLSLFGNLWSLGVEEQFYLLWPVVALFLLPSRPAAAAAFTVVTLLSMGLQMVMSTLSPTGSEAYYNTASHLFGLTLGCALAMVCTVPGRLLLGARSTSVLQYLGVAALGAIVLVCVVSASPLATSRALVLIGVSVLMFVVLAAVSAAPSGLFARALDFAALRWLGTRSYGVYLWHVPLIVVADSVFTPVPGMGYLPGRVGAVCVAVLVAALSYRFIEVPIRREGFRRTWRALTRGNTTAKLLTGAVVAAVMAALVGISVTAPAQTELEQRLTSTVSSSRGD